MFLEVNKDYLNEFLRVSQRKSMKVGSITERSIKVSDERDMNWEIAAIWNVIGEPHKNSYCSRKCYNSYFELEIDYN